MPNKSTAEKNTSWTLDNIKERGKEHPYTFYVPSQEAIADIRLQEHVKLFFTGPDRESGKILTERMWVLVTEVEGDLFKGTLDNDPAMLDGLSHGDAVTFSAIHIAATMKNDPIPSPTEKYELRCIASDQILRGEEKVNTMCREEPLNETDSGWRFTAQGEVLESINLNDISIVPLGAVLKQDDSMLAQLEAPIGSVFTKNVQTGLFEPTVDSEQVIEISGKKSRRPTLH
jgi:hypothetical protein